MKNSNSIKESLLEKYDKLEPGENDTWNPVNVDFELGYRLSHLYSLTKCLRLSHIPLKELTLLDIGCGNGRSTRIYIDLGLRPEQLTGIDVREGAISLASKLNPAINYKTTEGNTLEFPDHSFNWIQLTTAFSSIPDETDRRNLAVEVNRLLAPGGYLYCYDLYFLINFENQNMSRKILNPAEIFPKLNPVWTTPIRINQCYPATKNWKIFHKGISNPMERLKSMFRSRRYFKYRHPSHFVFLGQKSM